MRLWENRPNSAHYLIRYIAYWWSKTVEEKRKEEREISPLVLWRSITPVEISVISPLTKTMKWLTDKAGFPEDYLAQAGWRLDQIQFVCKSRRYPPLGTDLDQRNSLYPTAYKTKKCLTPAQPDQDGEVLLRGWLGCPVTLVITLNGPRRNESLKSIFTV